MCNNKWKYKNRMRRIGKGLGLQKTQRIFFSGLLHNFSFGRANLVLPKSTSLWIFYSIKYCAFYWVLFISTFYPSAMYIKQPIHRRSHPIVALLPTFSRPSNTNISWQMLKGNLLINWQNDGIHWWKRSRPSRNKVTPNPWRIISIRCLQLLFCCLDRYLWS